MNELSRGKGQNFNYREHYIIFEKNYIIHTPDLQKILIYETGSLLLITFGWNKIKKAFISGTFIQYK